MPRCSTPEAYQLLHDGSLALSKVEAAGVRIDMEYLNDTTTKITQRIANIEGGMKKTKVWKAWTKKFGLGAKMGSRPQLSKLLFEDMGYKIHEYTDKTKDLAQRFRKAKMDKTALERVKHPFVSLFLEAEAQKKVLSTYLDGLRREAVKAKDGCWYIHPSYNLNIASTYRSTCNLPNFQNVPKRNEEMWKLVRRNYLPHPGHHLVEIDFNTLEVRIAYCYHKDPVMFKYLTDPTTDMHRDMAMKLFKLEFWDNDFKKTLRDSAKNQLVFPEFYGSVYFQCAKNIWERMKRDKWKMGANEQGTGTATVLEHLKKLGIKKLGKCDPERDPEKGTFEWHVQQVEKELWNTFSVYAKWKQECVFKYQQTGSLEMLTGFIVNTNLKRNEITNYGTQGSASHCLLWSLIQMVNWIDKYDMKSRVIGQVHDSLVASVHPRELQDFLHRAKWVMQYLLPRHWDWIQIPLVTESDVAPVDEPWTETKLWVEDALDGDWRLAI